MGYWFIRIQIGVGERYTFGYLLAPCVEQCQQKFVVGQCVSLELTASRGD